MTTIDAIKSLVKSGDVAGAEALCRKVLEADPDNAVDAIKAAGAAAEPIIAAAGVKRPVKKRILGAFEIVKDLAAKGAQGKLYVGKLLEPCFDGLAVGDLVALKVMEVHDDDGERAFRRLKRRTDALVAAAHPGVVRYYGCFDASDESKDQHVIVMELLTGQTLEERLGENRLGLDADYALRIITICADALVHVAEYGLVHRDIKPSNIFLCDNGGVKLIGFEIARQEGASRTTTESGAMRGTVDYMAPDFHPDYRPDKGFHGDECSDVFSLTVCLYEMLAGSRPYAVGGMMGEQSMMAYFQRWTKVAGTDVSKSLKIESYKIHALAHVQKVIRKGLSPERPGRYQSYLEFREALRQVRVREVASPEARYELLRCVGKGGFGVVFRARRKSDGLVVAIKVLLRAEYSERFTREAKALAKFHDDRLVSFVEYFSIARNASETYFIVMQFLEGMPGSSLRDRIAEANGRGKGVGRLRLREILIAFKRYAGGLKVLHDGGIIHRDIKPANLYMPEGAPERSCVMDLGVVKTDETQTNGSLPGTLDYMPPEMALGQSRGSPAVDIYALGLCLHEALTGEPLFPRLKRGGDGLAEFYRRAKEARPPDLSRLDQMPTWQSIVRNMTAHGVADRIGDCAIVMSLLDAVPAAELADLEPQAAEEDLDDDDTFVPRPVADVAQDSLRILYAGPAYNPDLYVPKPAQDPLHGRSSLDTIKSLMKSGDVAGAEALCRKVLEADPDNAEIKMRYGICRELLGDEKTFKEIHDELAPEMDEAEKKVTLWRKYHEFAADLDDEVLVIDSDSDEAEPATVYEGPEYAPRELEPRTAYGGPGYEPLDRDGGELYGGPGLVPRKRIIIASAMNEEGSGGENVNCVTLNTGKQSDDSVAPWKIGLALVALVAIVVAGAIMARKNQIEKKIEYDRTEDVTPWGEKIFGGGTE